MSGALCAGSGARLTALATQIDNSVLPAVREVPWKVTALPAARQDTGTQISSLVNLFPKGIGSSIDLAANTTLQTLVSVTGSGFLEHAHVRGLGYPGTVSLQIICDGVTLLDATGASTSEYRLLSGCGVLSGLVGTIGLSLLESWKVPFRTSLVLKAQQSATGISAALLYRYLLAEPYTV